jgi:coenzyme F420-reducing hydrogenase delta subunit
MRHFGLDEFKEVLQPREGPAVTLLMPTLAGGTHFRQNSVRFKNQIRAAEEALSDRGLSAARIKELMAPATEMLGDTPFWEKQSRGLVMFLAPGFSRHYRVPLTLPEMAVVLDGSFHVKPLVPLVAETGRFFLLTLSQNQVSFYEAFRDGMTEIEPVGLPPSLREFLEQKGGEGRRKLQTRTMGTTERSGVSHGHDPADQDKERLAEYFREVENAVWEVLRQERVPLLLAGVEYLHPIYREANRYPHLFEQGLHGNVESLSEAELFSRAWEVMETHLHQQRAEAISRFQDRMGTGLASTETAQVVPAACQGRVDTLFVPVGVQVWGRYLPESSEIEVSATRANGQVDLLNLAAVQTLSAGGRVLVLDPAEVPGGAKVAAIFRY